MTPIDQIIATARRDSRCVSGSETRALCDEIERLRELARIGEELAGHITRPVALSMPFDRDVLRHWANRFHEAKRARKDDRPAGAERDGAA